MSAAVIVGGSFAWACTAPDGLSESTPTQWSQVGGAAPPAVEIPAAAPVASEPAAAPANVSAAPAARSAPASTSASATRPAAIPVAQPAPVAAVPGAAPAPVAALPSAPAAQATPAAPAPAAVTADLWSGFETSRTATNRPNAPAGSDTSGNGQFGLGLALLGAGIATLAAGGVVASRRRTVAVPE